MPLPEMVGWKPLWLPLFPLSKKDQRPVPLIYDLSKMKYISDEALIEHVLLYLDIDDINKLFPLFGYKKVKRVWLDRVAPQGEMFRTFNILYAWYYFGAKRPEAYVKSIETRHINKLMTV